MKHALAVGPAFCRVGRRQRRGQSAVELVNVRIQAGRLQCPSQTDLNSLSNGLFVSILIRRPSLGAGGWDAVADHLFGDGERVQRTATQWPGAIGTAHMVLAM